MNRRERAIGVLAAGDLTNAMFDPEPSLEAQQAELIRIARTSLLLHDVATLISYVSHVMTLLPGDMILTGTPSGVGPMTAGQTVSVTIEGIGTLSNPVRAR